MPSPAHIGSKRLIKPEDFFDFRVRGFRCPLRDMINHISVYKLKLTNYRIKDLSLSLVTLAEGSHTPLSLKARRIRRFLLLIEIKIL